MKSWTRGAGARMRFMRILSVTVLLAACASGNHSSRDATAPQSQQNLVSSACANAFELAAAVSPYEDTHEDLFPAYSACTSIEEWKTASERYPDAIDGVDPISYAMTVCATNQSQLRTTPICRVVNASTSGATALRASGRTGLLGVPLPKRAKLVERKAADPSTGRDPSERYSISASAADIASFFDHVMPAAGWAKDGISTDTGLFYRKGDLLIGILFNSKGGTFTLLGS